MGKLLVLPFAVANAAVEISEPFLELGLKSFFRLAKGMTHEGKVRYLGPNGVQTSAIIRVRANSLSAAEEAVMSEFFRYHFDTSSDCCDLRPSFLVEV